MAADDGARARRQLARLISYRGRAKVREILGVDDGMLTSLLDGSLDWPADARERFDRAWGLMVMLGAPEEEPDEVDEAPGERITDGVDQAGEVENLAPAPGLGGDGNPVAGAEQPVVDPKLAAAAGGEMTPGSGGAVRTVVDAKPDAVVPREGVDHRRQTAAAAAISAADEQLQDLWWSARCLVITRYLRPPGVPRHQRLSAWAVLLRLEIQLIRHFEFPLPRLWERRVRWDAGQRQQQLSRRTGRLRNVERKQEKLHLRRLAGWLRGRNEDRNELLQQRLLDDARQRGPIDSLMLVSAEPDWNQLDRMVPPGR